MKATAQNDGAAEVPGRPAWVEGEVPSSLEGALIEGVLVDASEQAVLLRVPGVARYLVRHGQPVLVERLDEATDADLLCFLDVPVAAAVRLLRGEVVLRAAAVSIEGRAVVLCGHAAVGKSALAAALALRGHLALADAVTAIATASESGQPLVSPLAPELRLWPDAVDQLELADHPARLVRAELPMRGYRLGPEPEPARPALVAVVVVDPLARDPRVERVTGFEKAGSLLHASWHSRVAEAMGLRTELFLTTAGLAADVEVVRLARPRRGASPEKLAAILEGLLP